VRPLPIVLSAIVLAALLMFGKDAERLFAAVPTPTGPGASTVYAVTNPNTTALLVTHTHTSDAGIVVLTFADTVPAATTVQYRVLDMPAIPSPYSGSLLLEADQPFTADVTGYTYPTATVTVTMSPTGTPTLTHTPTSTPTNTPTPTPTATPEPWRITLPIIKR
jgi:hypothetical protein